MESQYFDYGLEPVLSEFDIEQFLERSQSKEKQRLEGELEQIKSQLEERKEIHQELLSELKSKLEWYQEKLAETRIPGRRDEEEQIRLKNRISTFYRELREEKQRHWEDRQQLEKERRQLQRDLDQLAHSELATLL